MGLIAACSDFFAFLGSLFQVLPKACQFLITGIFGAVLVVSIMRMLQSR